MAVQQVARTATKPLVEVIFGVSFAAPQFSVVDYGLAYEIYKEQFPVLAGYTMPAISDPNLLLVNAPLLPRAMFQSANDHYVLQLQSDRLLLNWRRLQDDAPYPGFDFLFPMFMDIWNRFTKLFEQQQRGPVVVQSLALTYTNNLSQAFVENVPGQCFRWESHGWRRVLPEPAVRVVQYVFEFGDNVRIRAATQPAIDLSSQRQVTSMQLDSGTVVPTNDLESWFRLAHDHLHETLEDLVTEDALSLWRAKE
jgi:uncharacterized protein (TIGR04255 family)